MAGSSPSFPSSSPRRFPEWQTQYEAALLETDEGKLPKLVAAELAILDRLECLVGKAGNEEERGALSYAFQALRYLKGSISL